MYMRADLVAKLGPRMPPSYVGRVESKGQATLVITSAIFEDSTYYRCRLDAKDGGFKESYIQLVVIGMAHYQLLIRSAFTFCLIKTFLFRWHVWFTDGLVIVQWQNLFKPTITNPSAHANYYLPSSSLECDIIIHSKRSLLFSDGTQWEKKIFL